MSLQTCASSFSRSSWRSVATTSWIVSRSCWRSCCSCSFSSAELAARPRRRSSSAPRCWAHAELRARPVRAASSASASSATRPCRCSWRARFSRWSCSVFTRSAATARSWCSTCRATSPPAAVMRSVLRLTRSNSSRCSRVKRSSRCARASARSFSSPSSLARSSRRPCSWAWSFWLLRSSFSALSCRSCTRCCKKARRLRAETRSGLRRSSFARDAATARSACVAARCACARSRSAASKLWRLVSIATRILSRSLTTSAFLLLASSSCLAMP
mmetsp:Transcript_116019/g.374750  ORF Transcript_116019/g.374750 Transcript_116019/m.374750 type:complete len:273 (-) Transcript_116019:803-1621(-)